MYIILAIAAAVAAMIIVGFGVFAAYLLIGGKQRDQMANLLKRWTVFDYILLGAFLIGSLFLLADLIGVIRDREAYPYYHFGYLLSGFAYNLIAGIGLTIRLGLTLRAAEKPAEESSAAPGADEHHREPSQAQEAEERVQEGQQLLKTDKTEAEA